MAHVFLYIKSNCPFCIQAKRMLEEKGTAYEEVDLNQEPDRRTEMLERADGRHTVPQIFIDGQGYGGFQELYALERAGKLDALLGPSAARNT